jgi:prolyl oligopeptidase
MRNRTLVVLASALVLAACSKPADPAPPPAIPGDPMPVTPKRPVVDTYHGVAVTDDYRWLENAQDPEVRAWSDGQNARTRAFLDGLPAVDAIRKRITELMKTQTVSYRGASARGDTLFLLKNLPTKQQPLLVTMKAPGDARTERVVFDPTALDAAGTTAMDFYEPSLDGRLVAISLSSKGSESGTVHVYETETGKEVGEPVPRVNGGTAGGGVAWNADGTGFWYTRYPREGERPAEDLDFFQQVWFHALGTPGSQDRYEVGKEFPRIAEIRLSTDEKAKWVLANVSNGDGGEHAIWLRGEDGKWTQVTRFEDGVIHADVIEDGSLFLLSRNHAPHGHIVRISASAPSLASAVGVVGMSDKVIEHFVATKNRLYVVDQTGGPEEVRVFLNKGGKFAERDHTQVPVPPASSVDEVVRVGDDDVLIRSQSYVSPALWSGLKDFKMGPGSITVNLTKVGGISDAAGADFSDAESVREWATSKDGTKVPMTIVRRKGTQLDGSNPTILYGYGGYGSCMTPRFRPVLRAWLDQGGVYAVANIRGGGEFGEEWHRAGNLTKKQNVFDDFAACAVRLHELGYARREKLALMGGSNGGLLMGAMMTQHPELCRAIVSSVGIYDMLRVETTPNGAFNVTEFGTVKDPEQFRALYAYSPLHHVTDGVKCPSVMFVTGANDPRVDPYHSRKMTARLLAASSSGNPVLLRTSANAGHGMGSSLDQRIEQETDVHAFLFHELGMEFKGP